MWSLCFLCFLVFAEAKWHLACVAAGFGFSDVEQTFWKIFKFSLRKPFRRKNRGVWWGGGSPPKGKFRPPIEPGLKWNDVTFFLLVMCKGDIVAKPWKMLTQHPIQNPTTQRQVNFWIPGLLMIMINKHYSCSRFFGWMSKSKLIALPKTDITLAKSVVGRWMFRLKWHLFRVHVSFWRVYHISPKKSPWNSTEAVKPGCFPGFHVKCRVADVVGDAEVNVGNSSSEIHGFRSVYESWGRQCEWLLDWWKPKLPLWRPCFY